MNENGSNGTIHHDKIVFGEMAPVLDAAFEHYLKADVLAEARSYRDEERNAVAEQRAAKYDRLRAKALQMHQERPRGLYAECDAPNESLTPPWIRQDGPATYSAPRKGGVMEVRNVR